MGKYFAYSLEAFNALSGLGLMNAIRILLSHIKARFQPSEIEENFEQWVTNRFAKQPYDIFFKTYTVGHNGMHRYNNQDHSILTAMMAVWTIQGASHDIWAVNTDFESHEEQWPELPTADAAA